MSNINVADRALLAHMTISVFGNSKTDSEASERTRQLYGAKPGQIKASKILLPKIALVRVNRLKSATDLQFKSMTLPYEGGYRLLPSPNIMDVQAMVTQVTKRISRAVKEDILDKLDYLKAEMRQAQGTLFKEEHFPQHNDLRQKYGVKFDLTTLPSSDTMGKFVNELGDAKVREYKGQIDKAMQAKLEMSMRDVWSRLYDAIKHLRDRLGEVAKGEGKRLSRSVVDDLSELVDLLPKLNITDDVQLNTLTQRVKDEILVADVDETCNTLRTDTEVRTKQMAVADDIMNVMGGFYKPRKAA